MSDNIDELRNMLITFRVSELQMLLGFAGRNKSGRKTELQARALELLRVRSHPIHQKIRELYKTIQQSGGLTGGSVLLSNNNSNNSVPASSPSPGSTSSNRSITPNNNSDMPLPQGNVPTAPTTRTTAAVIPYNIDTRSIASRQNSLYNQNVYNPYQYATQKSQQQQQQSGGSLSASATNNNSFPIHPDVKFRRLPFYDVLSDLLKPSSLVPQNNQRMQEAIFYFHLTPQQATDIAMSRDMRPGVKVDYVKQVQMRFCLLETTCEQDDYFPPSVTVKVNNKPCALPNAIPTNKPGVEPKRPPRPVNITGNVKLSPTVANTIAIQWAPDYGRGYAISVSLVQKLTSSDLLQRLKNKGAKHSDHTRGLIKEKLKEDAESEITTTCLRVSLICPLGKMRITTPCRAITCAHLQCFDSSLFLQMNERKPTWSCPVCDKPALYDNLVIDGYFQEVLVSPTLSTDINEIQLHRDGSWSTQLIEKKITKTEKMVFDDSIEIIGDDVEYVSSGAAAATSSTDKNQKNNNNSNNDGTGAGGTGTVQSSPTKDVVDLTVSDSDDDEPLAKRRILNPKPDSTIKFSDTTSISSSSNQSRVTTTPGPSSVSSSGYPASPSIITLDSPSPPRSPHITADVVLNQQQQQQQPPPSSCMLASTNGTNGSGGSSNQSMPMFSPSSYMDLENEANSSSGGVNNNNNNNSGVNYSSY